MRRAGLIALLGLLLAAVGYGYVYATRTATERALCQCQPPELAWLKREFGLNAADFDRVCKLHEAYKPKCAEMCRRIDEKNRELSTLLGQAAGVNPQIEKALGDLADLRRQCQTTMLGHLFEVSRAMPPEQGRRYLAWMQEQVLSPSHPTMLPQPSVAVPYDQPHR